MSAKAWRRWRVALGTALPLLLVWRVGAGPFLTALRGLDPGLLLVGLLLGAVVTASCAWRWRLVARAVGIPLSLPAAASAYYRAQFLNTVLPGGVLGDVERGLRHGAQVTDTARAVRAVVWERFSGQAVQVGLTVVLLTVLPSPLGSMVPTVGVPAVLAAVAVAGAVWLGVGRLGVGRLGVNRRGPLRAEALAVLGRRTLPGVVGSSLLATTGHVVTFVLAARAVGVAASVEVLVPLALLVLVAMVVPIGLGGWGPREGMAAWAFAAAGLDAGQGVATALVFGVLGVVAGLPGLVLLVVGGDAANRSPRSVAPAGSGVPGGA
jgi:glycosyltransferase 2 family protein